jgi:hypothetical protein
LAVLVGFINCLLSQPEELKDRLKIRTEFMSKKIYLYKNTQNKIIRSFLPKTNF